MVDERGVVLAAFLERERGEACLGRPLLVLPTTSEDHV